jgi:hypothetical protein
MKRGGFWMVVPAVVLALVAARSLAHDGHDEGHGFSNRTIKGDWGFVTSLGMLVPPAVPQAVPTTGLGRVHFDGNGNCQVTTFANINGETQRFDSSSCTYAVNPDGTGTSDAFLPGAPVPGPINVAFVIVDRGQEIRLMNTRFIVGTFTARRQ